MLGEGCRSMGEHTRLVGDVEMHVERCAPAGRIEPRQLAPAGVVLEKARAGRADDADEVGDDCGCRLDPAGARPAERDLADRIALQHHGIRASLYTGQRMGLLDERRLHADVDRCAGERRYSDQLDGHAEPGGSRYVRRLDTLDPAALHVVEQHAGAERHRREDRHLRGRVGAADVVGRIRLGEAERLRLGKRLGVRAASLHLREHEVRRAVDDAEDAVHVLGHERLAQHLHHRHGGADGCLEPQLDARVGRKSEELGAFACHELLVRRDDGLAGAEQLAHVAAGRFEPAHHLGDDVDPWVVAQSGEVVGEHALLSREASLPRRVSDERAHDRQPVARCALDRPVSSTQAQGLHTDGSRPAPGRQSEIGSGYSGSTASSAGGVSSPPSSK